MMMIGDERQAEKEKVVEKMLGVLVFLDAAGASALGDWYRTASKDWVEYDACSRWMRRADER